MAGPAEVGGVQCHFVRPPPPHVAHVRRDWGLSVNVNMNVNPEFDDEDDEDDTQDAAEPQQNRGDRKWVRDLERRAKQGDRATAERDSLMRELALLKAGIDVTTPQGKLFAKAYDGEPSVDAITEAAREYGVLGSDVPAKADELAAMDRVARNAAGVTALAEDDPLNMIQRAETVEEVLRIVQDFGGQVDYDSPGGLRSLV